MSLAEAIETLCQSVELNLNDVAHISITPKEAQFKVWLRNEEGRFHLDRSGEAAFTWKRFDIDWPSAESTA